MGLAIAGLGTILGAVNMITTVVCMRAPGMTMFRMPIFTWNILVTSVMMLIAFPLLTAALLGLAVDRHLGGHIYDPANGGVILWQHLFWFFGHPEVYIVAIPFFGIITEIVPVFSRKPVFGYTTMVYATVSIAALSTAVWAHHMFATGAVLLPFFSFMSYLIAIPTGIKFFNWIGTMWHGQLTFETPMLFSVGFMLTFLLGGLSGVMLASPPIDFHVTDTYFLVDIKDLQNALSAGQNTGTPLPLTAFAMEMMQAIKNDGHLEDDHSALVFFHEKLANTEVKRKAN